MHGVVAIDYSSAEGLGIPANGKGICTMKKSRIPWHAWVTGRRPQPSSFTTALPEKGNQIRESSHHETIECPFLTLLPALLLGGTNCPADTPPVATFYVADSGDDANPGTQEEPFANLEAARDAVRKAGPGPYRIVVKAGNSTKPARGSSNRPCGPGRWPASAARSSTPRNLTSTSVLSVVSGRVGVQRREAVAPQDRQARVGVAVPELLRWSWLSCQPPTARRP